jgi:hypothetical protein
MTAQPDMTFMPVPGDDDFDPEWDQVLTACHEAAHAVAYWMMGRPFRYVTIRARGAMTAGRVMLYRPRYMGSRNLALVAAAGPVAELRYGARIRQLPDSDIVRSLTATADEDADGDGDLSQFARLVPTAAWVACWRDAERAVSGLWPAVEAVAGGLLASTRALTWADVSRTCDAATTREGQPA